MRITRCLLLALVLLNFAVAPALAQDDAKPRYPNFSDEAVETASQKAVDFLWSKLDRDHWSGYHTKDAAGVLQNTYPTGPTALAAYALMEQGVSPQDERMAKILDWLVANRETDYRTYSVGLRCMTWLTASRTDPKWLEPLKKDVDILVRSTKNGSYGYTSNPDKPGSGDNSCSQYGLLGVWGGAMADLEIPNEYWARTLKHWLDTQNADGGWSYMWTTPQDTRPTMAAAGVASLFVCFDNLLADGFLRCNTALELRPVAKGLDYFDRNFSRTLGWRSGYYLYGIERIGLASGYKYFGDDDWYKAGASLLLRQQSKDGSWGEVYNTAYCLLFLARGRNPVLFNKLEYDGDWNNRPRDLANATRWLSRTFENTLAWQIITLKAPVKEWHDSPILYVSGSRPPQFDDEDLDKLREFVWQGGTIFSVAECNSRMTFGKTMRDYYAKLFPEYEMVEVPADHDLYNIHFQLRGRPPLFMITNGIRPLVIHCEEDLARSWQLYNVATDARSFQTAANLFMYITDKGTALRHRGTTLWPDLDGSEPKRTIKLARVKHNARYNPEPMAYDRLSLLMKNETGTDLQVSEPIEPTALASTDARIAVMTGMGKLALPADQQQALKQWVMTGGTLIVDAAGGDRSFADSAEVLIEELFGRRNLRALATTSPVYRLKGLEVPKIAYRRVTRVKMAGRDKANIRVVVVDDRPAVLFSREDITAALVGYPSYTADGYAPESAWPLMRNMILVAAKTEVTASGGEGDTEE
jgi:hypothetical protein